MDTLLCSLNNAEQEELRVEQSEHLSNFLQFGEISRAAFPPLAPREEALVRTRRTPDPLLQSEDQKIPRNTVLPFQEINQAAFLLLALLLQGLVFASPPKVRQRNTFLPIWQRLQNQHKSAVLSDQRHIAWCQPDWCVDQQSLADTCDRNLQRRWLARALSFEIADKLQKGASLSTFLLGNYQGAFS